MPCVPIFFSTSVLDMKVLRMISGVNRRIQWEDRMSNDNIREELGVNSVEEAARRSRLRWWGHVQRIDEDRIPKKLLDSGLVGKRGRGRPRRKWVEAVGSDLDVTGVSWNEAVIWTLDRARWRRVINGKVFVDTERHTTNG